MCYLEMEMKFRLWKYEILYGKNIVLLKVLLENNFINLLK